VTPSPGRDGHLLPTSSGTENSGWVGVGPAVTNVQPGDTIDPATPSRPAGCCRHCRAGRMQ